MSSLDQILARAKDHAILVGVGALILVPIGVLIPRYTRTFNPQWFNMHAFWMLFISAPVLLAGIAKGIMYTGSAQTGGHFVDPHKKMGLAILILFCLQILGGIFIHSVKIPFMGGHRPPQNYFHAIMGLAIIAAAFWQVWYGITKEWVEGTGGVTLPPHSALVGWKAWAAVFWILYFGGLALLPRQYAQERRARESRLTEKTNGVQT